MNYANIKEFDIANGPGVRISLFVSGCTNHCKNCFQPETWDFNYGEPYTDEVETHIIESLKLYYYQGLTILGGEPFEPSNQERIAGLIRKVKAECPDKDIWMFTGFVYDKDLIPGGRKYCEYTDYILSQIDVLVDGPFIDELKNISLQFRGSENQRLIDMPATRRSGTVTWWQDK